MCFHSGYSHLFFILSFSTQELAKSSRLAGDQGVGAGIRHTRYRAEVIGQHPVASSAAIPTDPYKKVAGR